MISLLSRLWNVIEIDKSLVSSLTLNFHSLTYQPNSLEELKKMNGKFDKLNNKIELMSNNFSYIAKHIK